MNELMTMEEFDSALRALFFRQCESALSELHIDEVPESKDVTANSAMEGYLQSSGGYTDWRMVPAQSAYNIGSGFGSHPEFGEKLGFIDLGVIFKRGKSGMLFFERGFAVKSSSDNTDTALSYEDLCRTIIRKSSESGLNDGKFIITYERTAVIRACGRMFERLSGIKAALLSSSKSAQYAFCDHCRSIIDNAKYHAENKALGEADLLSSLLCEFAAGDSRRSVPIPYAMWTAALIMQHKFDEAASIASENALLDWQKTALEKKSEYYRILGKSYYDSAAENYHAGKCSESLADIHRSIDTYPTVENWKLYFTIVNEFAGRENMYLYDEVLRILNSDPSASDIRRAALESSGDVLKSLTKKKQKFTSYLRELMIDRIINEDMEFFRANKYNINSYVDIYGMTTLSYAALYRKTAMLPELMNLSRCGRVVNIIDHDMVDVCAFSSVNIFEYDKFAGNYDLQYQNLKRSAAYSAPPYAQNYGTPYAGNFQQPYNNGYPVNSAQYQNPQAVNNQVYHGAPSLAADSRMMQYYNWRVSNVWTPVLNFVRNGLEKLPEFLDENASANDYAAHPTYREAYAQRREDYIAGYLRSVLQPKGEFETSAQYEERYNAISQQAKHRFEAEAKEIMRAYENELREKVRVNGLCVELSYIYLFASFSGNAYLGRYDADAQRFAIRWNSIESTVAVSLQDARGFKEAFAANGVQFEVEGVTVDNERNVSASCTIEFGGKSYPFTLVRKA